MGREVLGGLQLPVDTGSQAVCSVTDTLSLDQTMSPDGRWEQFATLLTPLSGLTGSVVIFHGLTGLAKSHP